MSRSDWTTPDLSAASARWNQTDSSMNEEPFSRSARRRTIDGVGASVVAFVGAPVGDGHGGPDAHGDLRPDAHDRGAVLRAHDGHVRADDGADGYHTDVVAKLR